MQRVKMDPVKMLNYLRNIATQVSLPFFMSNKVQSVSSSILLRYRLFWKMLFLECQFRVEGMRPESLPPSLFFRVPGKLLEK